MSTTIKWFLGILIGVIILGAGFLIGQKSESKTISDTSSPVSTSSSIVESEPVNLKVGDKMYDMVITAITPIKGSGVPSQDNSMIKFVGETEVTGTYHNYSLDEGMLGGKVCIDNLDFQSVNKMPKVPGDTRTTWFCFDNDDFAKTDFAPTGSSGRAKILIDQYTVNSFPSSVWNTAKLVKVIQKQDFTF